MSEELNAALLDFGEALARCKKQMETHRKEAAFLVTALSRRFVEREAERMHEAVRSRILQEEVRRLFTEGNVPTESYRRVLREARRLLPGRLQSEMFVAAEMGRVALERSPR